MSDFRSQIQKHYDAQNLPAAKADAILASGGTGAADGDKIVALPARRAQGWRIAWALAASFVLLAGLVVWWRPQGRGTVSYAVFAPRIVEFFGKPPELPKRSQNPEELRAWLLAQGAPADFQIPEKLRPLKSFGCQVVDVHGRPAYLTCFWAEKKPGVDDGSLVHLWVARRSDFRDAPPTDGPQFRELNGWSFAAWSDGDVIYTMAAAAPLEKLRNFVREPRTGSTGRMLITKLSS
jgi:hypothetical protein